jgi:serine O-acetyltransferase
MNLDMAIEAILDSYKSNGGLTYHETENFPNRQVAVSILEDIRCLLFPGFSRSTADAASIRYVTGERIHRVIPLLAHEIQKAMKYMFFFAGREETACFDLAELTAYSLIKEIPEIRRLLNKDIEAALQGDPAATTSEEVILSYPGVEAVIAYRIAHFLHINGVPIIPRILSEYVHGKTGIEIHPGAVIGESFFIDHGTGVVIGETCVIGSNVTLYQGVTLGALSVKKTLHGKKRHPTIEDDVTIYAGATILGDTVIGRGSTIGGNAWVTASVPPDTVVMYRHDAQ